MKKTQRKYLFRTIKKNLVSFLAIALIVTTGVSIYLGDQSSVIAILQRASQYFVENKLQSLEITSGNGITEDDIKAIAKVEGVDEVEGGFSSMVFWETGTQKGKVLVQAHSLLDNMNQPVIVEGTLPTTKGEVAIEEKMAIEEGIKVGDTFSIDHEGELKEESFVVTAIINEPAYTCMEALDARGKGEKGIGAAYYYIVLIKNAFDKSHFDDCYTTAYIKNYELDNYYYFSDEYKEHEAVLKEKMELLGEEQSKIRYEEIKERAENELAEAREELDNAKKEIEDGKIKLADGEKELVESEKELANGEKELADGEKELANAEKELANGERELASAKEELADGEREFASARRTFNNKKAELDDAKKEIRNALKSLGLSTNFSEAKKQLQALGDAGKPLVSSINEYNSGERKLEDARKELTDAENELASARREVSAAENEIADAKTEIANAKTEMENARVEIADAKVEIENAKVEIADAKVEIADAEAKVADAEEEYKDAEEEVKDIQVKRWIVSIRNDIGDVRSIETVVGTLEGLSYSMAVIFLIVSITVCHAAIARMINEQRALIGVQKALGFTDKEILTHYMSYSLICGIWGIVQGWISAFYLVQALNLGIYADLFRLGEIKHVFSWPHAIIVSVVALIVFAASAYFACAKEIALPATDLLRGEMPEREKPFFFENWKFYQKRKSYTRAIVKNALGDKARMATNVMGIVGCMALLVMCFTLQVIMENSSAIQFEKYFLYENRLVIDSEKTKPSKFEKVLEEEGISYTKVQDKLHHIRKKGGNWSSGHIMAISDSEALKEYVLLEDASTKQILEVPQDGVLVSARYAEVAGLKKGSVFEVMDKNGNVKEMVVSGLINHYLNYYMFVTSDSYYEEAMGKEADECVFLLKGNIDGLYEKVGTMKGFISLRDNSEFGGMGSIMELVVLICFIFAGVMAVLVLFNQNVMYINRKAKELSVMRINGFTLRETKRFISRDNTILTIIGLIMGCGVGMLLSYMVVRIMEIGPVAYVHAPSADACISAIVVASVFAIIVNKLALRRIRRLNLIDINAN